MTPRPRRRVSSTVPVESGSHRALLEQTRQRLSGLGTQDEVFAALVRTILPMRAEMCIVDVVEPDGTIRNAVVLHADPAKGQFVRDWSQRNPLPPNHPVHEVAASRRPMFCTKVGDAILGNMAADDVHLAVLRRHGPRSFVSVPILEDGLVRAVLTCAFTSPSRRFTPGDFAFLCELGPLVSASLEAVESRGRTSLRSDVAPSSRRPDLHSSRSARRRRE